MNNVLEFIESVKQTADDLLKRLVLGPSRPGLTVAERPPSPSAIDRRTPRDTAIIVDVSGSMGECDYPPTRLAGGIQAGMEHAATCAKERPTDRIAVISFTLKARVMLPLTPVTRSREITKAFRRLTAGGGTDLAQGLKAAAHLFDNQPQTQRRRHVILLTDGQGGEPLKIAARLKEKIEAVIDVVGIGGTPDAVNEALLRQVATTDSDGFCHYRFVKDPQTLSEHYTQLAQGLLWRGGGQ